MAKSLLLNSLASSKATAIASPRASAAVVLVVGARSRGHASSDTPVSRLISALLAILEVLDPVIEKYSQPTDFK